MSYSPAEPGSESVRPIFVFGISGATWDVIDPLIEQGLLPTFSKLKQQGVSGQLASIKADGDKHYRPQVAYPCIATGYTPQNHGITEFFHTSENLKVPAIWDIFNQQQLTAGLYGWPMTWPTAPMQGFAIPCHHARDSKTSPISLEPIKALDRQQQNAERAGSGASKLKPLTRLLKLLTRYMPPISTMAPLLKTAVGVVLSSDIERRSLLLRRAKFYLSCGLFMALQRQYQPKLSMFNTFYVDLVEHRFWRYHQREHFDNIQDKPQLSSAVNDSYRQVDKMLGKMIERLPKDAIVAVVSEHGMAVEPISAEVGQRRYAINGNGVHQLLKLAPAVQMIPVARWVAIRDINGQSISQDIIDSLSQITVEQTQLPLFNVHRNGAKEVVIKFNFNDQQQSYRDIDLETLTINIQDQSLPFLAVATPSVPKRSAMHSKQGILLLSGQGIKTGMTIDDAQIIDITPTLLQGCGMPLDPNMDGKVLDVFE